MNETRLNIRISQERKEALIAKSKREKRNVTDVVTDLIDEYLGMKTESTEILEMKRRIQKLEEVVMGEIAA